jgi:hypothetical protein
MSRSSEKFLHLMDAEVNAGLSRSAFKKSSLEDIELYKTVKGDIVKSVYRSGYNVIVIFSEGGKEYSMNTRSLIKLTTKEKLNQTKWK